MALIGVASVYLSAAPLTSYPVENTDPTPLFELALATESNDCSRETSLGFEALLYGIDSEARQHFVTARENDDTSPLPSIGLALLSKDPAERSVLVNHLRRSFKNISATPSEAFYLSAFLTMLEGKTAEAAKAFAKRADEFPRDVFSASWAILLLHYSNYFYDSEGNLNQEHEEAIARAEKLYDMCDKSFSPACYLRALVEESSPHFSPEALEAAALFSEQLPGNATALTLYAHHLYKSNRAEQAAALFHQAYKAAESKHQNLLALRAHLYESVALWSCDKYREAYQIRRVLNRLTFDANSLSERDIFLAWEAHTLPLRILVLRKKLPHPSDVSAALSAAAPSNNKNEIIAEAAQCIADTMMARLDFCASKKSSAMASLKKAESHLSKFEEFEASCAERSLALMTPYKRLHDACIIAINKAKAELFSSSADIWNENIRRTILQSLTDSTLPPVVPMR